MSEEGQKRKKIKNIDSVFDESTDHKSRISYGLKGRKNNLGIKAVEEKTVKSPKL